MILSKLLILWYVLTGVVSPMYEFPEAEGIIFRRVDTSAYMVEPQAVYFNQTINLVYANPEQATVSVYTEQGILIDLTSVKSISTLPTGLVVHIISKCSQRRHPIKAYSTTFPTTNEQKVCNFAKV